MKARGKVVAAVAGVGTAVALLLIRPFAASMALVFAALGLVAVVIARDAFVPDAPDDR